MTDKKYNILIIGSGSWGTALSQILDDNGHNVTVYGIETDQIYELQHEHKNSRYFTEDTILSEKINYTDDLKTLFLNNVYSPDIIILSVPSNAILAAINDVKSYLTKPCIVINTSKGLTISGKFINDSLNYILNKKYTHTNTKFKIFNLFGPSHAEEVIKRDLTFLNLITYYDEDDLDLYNDLVNVFTNNYIKVKMNFDPDCAELCAAFKNVVALTSGIFDGLGYKDNARAALFSMGLNEMYKLNDYFFKPKSFKNSTLIDFCGVGDLAVTCYSLNSRNFCGGRLIGSLNSYSNFEKVNTKTVEGIYAAKHFIELIWNKDILRTDFPILNFLYKIIYLNIEPKEAIIELINQ